MAIQSAAIIQGGPTSSSQQVVSFIMRSLSNSNVSAVMLCSAAAGVWRNMRISELWLTILGIVLDWKWKWSKQVNSEIMESTWEPSNKRARWASRFLPRNVHVCIWKETVNLKGNINHLQCLCAVGLHVHPFVCVSCCSVCVCLQSWWLNWLKITEKTFNYFPQAKYWAPWQSWHWDMNQYLGKQVTANSLLSGKRQKTQRCGG